MSKRRAFRFTRTALLAWYLSCVKYLSREDEKCAVRVNRKALEQAQMRWPNVLDSGMIRHGQKLFAGSYGHICFYCACRFSFYQEAILNTAYLVGISYDPPTGS